jgi:hypothetical protein
MASVLMEKAGERMFVPPEKVPAFLQDGWVTIKASPESPGPATAAAPQAEEIMPQAKSPAEVEETVKKIRKRGQ